jgi:hypothetical protein
MGKLAQQLGGQSQVKVFAKGGLVEKNEPKREERREAKLSPKARAKVERVEKHKCGGKVK